jgi:hypothetical protein
VASQIDSLPYKELDTALEEIRLIQLKPGFWDDDISLTILHAPLNPPTPKPKSNRLSLRELQEGLPDGLLVKETLSGRYIFCHPDLYNREGPRRPSSWNHPSPDVDRALYDLAEEDPQSRPKFEPEYEALSYTWESTMDPVHAYAIYDASGRSAKLQIRGNLACALKHLRFPDRDRVLWVDALCINQNDEKEKNI